MLQCWSTTSAMPNTRSTSTKGSRAAADRAGRGAGTSGGAVAGTVTGAVAGRIAGWGITAVTGSRFSKGTGEAMRKASSPGPGGAVTHAALFLSGRTTGGGSAGLTPARRVRRVDARDLLPLALAS
ncbi:hypothetical protein GCM10017559_54180 [Streptosporangium longisporum]|uniref:Uncharacterized protein n=1 Tax=Streptosporangium longisporum TaxID=46187 RepID=A0ABN3Y809_9ACTN